MCNASLQHGLTTQGTTKINATYRHCIIHAKGVNIGSSYISFQGPCNPICKVLRFVVFICVHSLPASDCPRKVLRSPQYKATYKITTSAFPLCCTNRFAPFLPSPSTYWQYHRSPSRTSGCTARLYQCHRTTTTIAPPSRQRYQVTTTTTAPPSTPRQQH